MKFLKSFLVTVFILLIPVTVYGGPVYDMKQIGFIDESGVYGWDWEPAVNAYSFPLGTVEAMEGQALFMANGEFMLFIPEIRDGRALMPLCAAGPVFGVADAESACGGIALTGNNITVFIPDGSAVASVNRGGVFEEADLLAAPEKINGRWYVPVRGLAEVFGSAAGYDTDMARNPVIWVDDFTGEWEADIESLRIKCFLALEILREAIGTEFMEIFSQMSAEDEFVSRTLERIARDIENMAYDRHIGRYAVISGLAGMLLIDIEGNAYLGEGISSEARIYRADFESPWFFLRYFHS